MRSIFIFLLIIISCSEIDNKNIKVQVPIPTSINSLFNEKPEIIKLDLTSSSQIESWVQMISFTEKFSDLLNSFSLTSLVMLSLGFCFWDKEVLLGEGLLVPIEF